MTNSVSSGKSPRTIMQTTQGLKTTGKEGKATPETKPDNSPEKTENMNGATTRSSSNYTWPHLYTEIDDSLEACLFVYPLVEVRRLVASGELDDPDGSIMTAPKSCYDALNIITSNASTIDKQDNNHLRGILSSVGDRLKRSGAKSSDLQETAGTIEVFYDGTCGQKPIVKESIMETQTGPEVSNSDDQAFTPNDNVSLADQGLSYSIVASHAKKRITLTLRGSLLNDFSWARATMKTVANPLAKHPEQKETMHLHSTFYDLLFKSSSRGAEGPNGEALTEYHDILLQVVDATKKYPGYKLYVTGWSQGGALATIFATVAAAELDSVLPKPITCVSFASPMVGDKHFRDLHQLLEQKVKLRHIRVSNHKDLLTTSPKMSESSTDTIYNLVFDEGTGVGIPFKTVGMSVKLHGGNEPFEVSFPKKVNSNTMAGSIQNFTSEVQLFWENSFFANFSWSRTEYSKYHNIWTYSQRLDRGSPLLEYMNLNDLYEDSDIVGDLFAKKVLNRAIR
uniref:Fungal lipase-type domain-containing protein n=1 Tax=Odontella aurita TaxID=265563 RepID=A0A7S4NFV7_9STRA|mmetsp:Transcript_62867/g.185688  ORF Transcript_62867/g.185688 Transcript_62867/m.185688 type:complete len:509 (+) Transcript_62867:326-1852(+)